MASPATFVQFNNNAAPAHQQRHQFGYYPTQVEASAAPSEQQYQSRYQNAVLFGYQQKQQYTTGYDASTTTNGSNNKHMPPMPSAPPPLPPTETELDLMIFEEPSVASSFSFDSASSPSQVQSHSPVEEGVLVPFVESRQDESALDRIIASQQRAMERASRVDVNNGSRNSSRAIAPSGGSSSYAMTRYSGRSGNTNLDSAVKTGVHPHRKEMKKERKAKTVGGAVGGAVLGGLVLGPVGVVLGGAAGGAGARRIAKAGEKRAQRKFEQRNVQQAALKSGATRGAAFA